MTLVPLTDCCLWLGIDPKTLRLWLKAANFSCCLHPTDARLKCLTSSHLQQLADLHGRRLPVTVPEPLAFPFCPPAQASSPPTRAGSSTTLAHADDAELRHQFLLLQAQVATLQAQVTELALVRSSCSQLSQPATSPPLPLPSPVPSTPALMTRLASAAPRSKAPVTRAAPPELERTRARSRALPLIEIRADGSVVVISPTEGVLSLVPDSPAWLAWFSSLTAFTFQGKQGRFSATRKTRDGKPLQAWNVHRSLHGRSCTLYLGMSSTLTLARLEDMAAAVDARLTAL